MKSQLVELLMARIGRKEETAEQAVDTLIDYIRHNPLQVAPYLVRHDVSDTEDRQGGLFG